MKKKVLFVAMQDSVHTIKWIRQLLDCDDLVLHFFPISKAPKHADLKGVIYHDPSAAYFEVGTKNDRDSPSQILQLTQLARRAVDLSCGRFCQRIKRLIQNLKSKYADPSDLAVQFPWIDDPLANDPRDLAKLIDTLKPDLIHSLEFQHCGYAVLSAKKFTTAIFPKWLATNWGSDVYYYRNIDEHKQMIRNLLSSADFYSCECQRDVEIVRELGYRNVVLPVIPNTGGIDLASASVRRARIPPSQRKSILIKGYQSFAGRALTALNAIALCSNELAGYTIKIYSATVQIRQRVAELRSILDVELEIVEKLDNGRMLDEFAKARAYIGIGVSDGISTSALEAMAMGAFPIQSNTSCCAEWFSDGDGGFIVPPDDIELISKRIKTMLSDDLLVEAASVSNWKTVKDRLDQNKVAEVARGYYKTIFS